jgi:hypothetical protein
MKRTAVSLVALLVTHTAWMIEPRAQPDVPGEALAPLPGQTQPTLVLEGPRLELSRPRIGARRELLAGIVLSATAGSLVVLGGGLMGGGYSNGAFTPGFAFSVTGASLAYPAVLTLLYGAGHNSALRELDGARVTTIERVEARARRLERTGIGLFGGGLGLMLVGTGMVIGGLQGVSLDSPQRSQGNAPLFWSGFIFAVIGDAAWLAGTLVWTYGGGLHRGVRQARASLHASVGGIAGTF